MNPQNNYYKTDIQNYLKESVVEFENPPIDWRGLYEAELVGDTVLIHVSETIILEGEVLQMDSTAVLFNWGGIRYVGLHDGNMIYKTAA
jgi:hypothetical protein